MKALDLIAEAMASRIENDLPLPAYDAIQLKAESLMKPMTPMTIQDQLLQSTTLGEIPGSTPSDTATGKVKGKRGTCAKKRKETEGKDAKTPQWTE